ncbi:DEP domain-containing protein 1A isoform X3 [Arvicola amphibius]|uniref:DEP domain-containing protein 1A isoform X3 n=1 Tax=Arvicola amphibius TaxID=1047088 RepID=UPI0018E39A82|nr:DEP domain-containing protein 1A isoform X3 [Arvicola amphibius]
MEDHGAPLGPYRATKLWNEVTTSFRVGMPLRKHRQHLKKYSNCFTAEEAVDWLYDLLRNNSNFGPEVTRQQTIQLLRKFLKNHVIEDIKGRWGSENLDDNNQLFRFPATSPLKTLPQRHTEIRRTSKEYFSRDKDSIFKLRNLSRKTPKKRGLHFSQENTENINHEKIINEDQENPADKREISQEDVEEVWRYILMTYLQSILGVPSIEDLINPDEVIPQYIMYNMSNTSKHGVVVLQDKSEDLPHWVLSAMKCLANWPRSNETNNPTYVGFERDVFRTIADYFLDLPEPLLTFKYYELFVNIMGLLQPHLERVAINALQLCCLLLPPPNRRKLQLLMRMTSRMSQNVDMPKLHEEMGTRSLVIQTFSRCVLCCTEEVDLDELLASRLISFLMDHHQEILQVPTYLQTAVEKHLDYIRKGHFKNPGDEQVVPLPTYSYCNQISTQEFDKQKVSTSQAAIEELLENIIRSKSLPPKEKRKKLKQFQKEYPLIYQKRFPTTESEAALLDAKPTIKQPMLNLRNPKLHRLRY